ncbi:MAG: calcineurin-like phosphoesterase family protein [Bacteroidales bacterium]|jgi:hypothetical protein|nr:calcineurin-like phosphoesterase family protein [Bacteroidales bacterium]
MQRKKFNGMQMATAMILFLLVLACNGKNKVEEAPDESPDQEQEQEQEQEEQPLDFAAIQAAYDTYGFVLDTAGHPLEGVVVSDGFSSSRTGKEGIYWFNRHANAYYVHYSVPENCRVPVDKTTGLPAFFQQLKSATKRYDFILKPMEHGVETTFTLVCIADPQVKTVANTNRFKNETVVDVRQHLSGIDGPKYGVVLGDIIFDVPSLFPDIRSAMHVNKTGVPLFQAIGNHDHLFGAANEIESQRNFERQLGPLNYSFNRGNAHIVVMDNVLHLLGSASTYNAGFTAEQFTWLQNDLSFVSKDKLLLFCVHIPFKIGSVSGGSTVNRNAYYTEVLNLLAEFQEAHIMVGHTHDNSNYIHTVKGKQIYEHVHGTACGAWWNSTIAKDGTPNGYAIYTVDGSTITNWYYKPTRYSKDFQIRLYRGTDVFTGGHASKSWQFIAHNAKQIIANVWNSDPDWVVKVYEDNTLTGVMSPYTDSDCWAVAYHVGNKGLSETTYDKAMDHFYHYTLTGNPQKVEIEAIDRFGNKYYQSAFCSPSAADYPDQYD